MDKMRWFSRSSPAEPDDERPPKRLLPPAGARLATITEGGPDGAIKQNKASRLSFQLRSSVIGLPSETSESYTTIWSDGKAASEPDSSVFSIWKEKKEFTRRGGWKRLLAIALVSLICILALVLGLVFGLKSSNNDSDNSKSDSSSSSDSSGSSSSQQKFPAGTYTFSTYLSTVATNCTASPGTWRCRPYTTFSDDPSKAAAMFNWKIAATGDDDDSYTITSTDPLSIVFKNIPLTLEGKGTDSERYTFNLNEDKRVSPTVSLTSDDSATVCFFNGTRFQASLYTKMQREYPSKGDPAQSKAPFDDWPFAVRMEEIIAGGDGVPNCYKTVDGVVTGEAIKSSKLKAQGTGDLCDCLYMNYMP